ncbi:hypothetical protein CFC21_102872 [Triticum aestivum]|uniref:Letm1 RBD domain-containing protein n=1 Tax=Triticum aestivum TaxID=4565 RepID=A0A9R1M6E5_WHEAT|nr:hypothetical protein CFC21_102872 [Triticum aestivum]
MATAVASQPRHFTLGGEPRAAICAASTSKICTLDKVYGFRFICRSVVDLRSKKFHSQISKRKCYLTSSPSEFEKIILSARWLEFRRQRIAFQRTRRRVHSIPLASQDDGSGVSVNGVPQVDPASQMKEIRVKLDKALQNEDISTGLVQSIHDAARSIELAFLDHSKSSIDSWFPKMWLGVDNNAWIKALSYQAAVSSLLQAVIDVSSRGNGRDRDINVFVQRRYLIGGSVLYYPQLSSISSYQLYVEVVCEELEWLPFYYEDVPTPIVDTEGREEMPKRELISRVLNVCTYWLTSFIKYSSWLENPLNVKAARFLSKGHAMLSDCMTELDIAKNNMPKDRSFQETGVLVDAPELASIDKSLESVEEALVKLENLLQELHLSSSNSGKEDLKAACSDLEMIRRLKKEAEFLEASFRAKAEYLEADTISRVLPPAGEGEHGKTGSMVNEVLTPQKPVNRMENNRRPFWDIFGTTAGRKIVPAQQAVDQDASAAKVDQIDMESNDIRRFEQLRRELIELERRVQKSTDGAKKEEFQETEVPDETMSPSESAPPLSGPSGSVIKKENVITKSVEKVKESTTIVLQGTQLLAIDTGAAMGLLKRSLIGEELTQKEKQALQRTLTDLASVVPIGILMLLPVTAVGHAAILAFIQRYVPSMIPSTYGPERLDLLRQLEEVKEMKLSEGSSEDISDAIGFRGDQVK